MNSSDLIRMCAGLATVVASWALSSAVAAADLETAARGASIAGIEQAFAEHRYGVADLAGYYIERIGAIDHNGPALHAIIEINPDWASLARDLDNELQSGGRTIDKALLGVPIVLKDNIDTADRMHTTAGSLALLYSSPRRDAFIVRRLRAAGALILAKGNMDEWAGMRDFDSIGGWSGRGGQTHNPYNPARTPGGSSGGPAVAVAADLAAIAIGTDTTGSIIVPASMNGVVGIRPTVGLVSREGIVPIGASHDTAGPLARTVADAAALLTVIAGYDPDDPATARLKDQPPPDFRLALKADSLKGARIGVLREFIHPTVHMVFDQALAALRAQGAVLIDVAFPNKGKLDDDDETVQEYEFKDQIARYLATRRGPGPKNLAELIAFDSRHAAEEMPYFGQDVFTSSQNRGPLTDQAYRDAFERLRRLAGPEGIDAVLNKDHLDALVVSSADPARMIDYITGQHYSPGTGFTSTPAAAGYPIVSVPMGLVHGMPVGLSFVGTAWTESKLLGLAYAFEQATHARRPPGQGVAQ